MTYRQDFRVNYQQNHMANTLHPRDLGTHATGWTIIGEIHEDYYEWINQFNAAHPQLGDVWGDFESIVYATSKEAYDDFYSNHPPEEWDYWDI